MSEQKSSGGGCLAVLIIALYFLFLADWAVDRRTVSCVVTGKGFTETQASGGEPLVLVYLRGRLHGCTSTESEWRGLPAGAPVKIEASWGRLSHHLYECATEAKNAERIKENRR